MPELLQVRTQLQLGPPDTANDSREQPTPPAGHVAVLQCFQAVIHTIEQQGAGRQPLLTVDDIEML